MNEKWWLNRARHAASELRSRGTAPFPLPDVFFVDETTGRLLESLVALHLLEPGEVPGIEEARRASRAA